MFNKLLLKIFKVLSVFPWIQRRILHFVNSHFLVGVVGLITDEKKRVILFHHTYRNRYPWGLPGGWLKKGEQPQAALVREIEEESGLAVEVEYPFTTYSKSALPMVEIVLKARLVKGEFQASDEVDEIRAVTADDIPDGINENQRKVLTDYFAGQGGKQ